MTPADRIAALTHNGISPPDSVLRSPNRVLLWKALVAGERMHKHLAAIRFGLKKQSALDALNELHAAGKVHIVAWTRNGDRGPMTKVFAFGPGQDVPHPPKLSAAFVCKRYRERDPERSRANDRRYRIKKALRCGKAPTGNDPLLRAIMGAGA